MTDDLIFLPDLETAMVAVYRGPLEEFVQRRDALVKQLRASRRREDADTARALRKPSRIAWALDNAVLDEPAPIERLAAAVTAALDAQSAGGGDLRAALDEVRASVRAFADAAALAATHSGHHVEATALVPAVMAVIGDARAFTTLRTGRLAEIPEGGGLDFLTAAPPGSAAPSSSGGARTQEETPSADAMASAQAELERAETILAEARERARAAERALQDVQVRLEAAEQQLERAQDEVNAQRTELARARQDAKTAAARAHDAERAAAAASARSTRLP
ncbi:MAG: hypothetical protein ACRENP_08300 [Longimicrobiales bacterium]